MIGYRDSIVSIEEGKGTLSATVSKNGTTSQRFTLTASTHTYSEILQLSSDFDQDFNTSYSTVATRRFVYLKHYNNNYYDNNYYCDTMFL